MINLKEITVHPIPQGRQAARAVKPIMLKEKTPITINLQGIVSVPVTFLDELLRIASKTSTDQPPETAEPVILENTPVAPKVIHQKIAARHGRQIVQQGKRWNITPTAQQDAAGHTEPPDPPQEQQQAYSR